MHETELWLTKIFNNHLAGLGNTLLNAVGMHPEARPWANFIVMELLVTAIIVLLFAVLRPRLSADNPGRLQHVFELIFEFLRDQTEDQVPHEGHRYLAFFGTIFLFVLFCNLLGLIPGFESPTMVPSVPLGCAVAVFVYYHVIGIMANGPVRYALNFAGPIWWMAPLVIPIEIVSHLARPLSLTIRLYANMYAGEQITIAFLGLTYFIVPVAFMGLHIFVSVLQAYIFMLLAAMYVAGAVAHEH